MKGNHRASLDWLRPSEFCSRILGLDRMFYEVWIRPRLAAGHSTETVPGSILIWPL